MNSTTPEVGNPSVLGPTYTLHAVGKYGHYAMLALAALSWAGEHLHLIGDQSQGTIQVTIAATALAFIGDRVGHAVSMLRGKP